MCIRDRLKRRRNPELPQPTLGKTTFARNLLDTSTSVSRNESDTPGTNSATTHEMHSESQTSCQSGTSQNAATAAEKRRLDAENDPAEQERKKQRLLEAAQERLLTLQGAVALSLIHI